LIIIKGILVDNNMSSKGLVSSASSSTIASNMSTTSKNNATSIDEDPDIVLFICDNNLDNTPVTKGFVSETGEEVAFSISQSRTSSKKVGQDAISALSRGNYECCVLCDGHDVHGDIVARGICKTLSALIIDHLLVSSYY